MQAYIPSIWAMSDIGAIADVVAGGTPKAGDKSNFSSPGAGFAWLTPADLSGYTEKYISRGSRDLSEKGLTTSSAKLMPAGSLLFSSRAPIGYVAIAANEISTNQGFKNFVFTNEIVPTYAYFYLKSIRELADRLGTGTTFKEISGATAKTLPFVIPPFAEQKEIADRLDKLLAQVEATQARLAKIPDVIKQFRQSVLTAAMNGKLTETWREYNKCISDDLVSKIKMARFKLWKEWQLDEFSAKGKTPKGHWESKYSEPVRNISIENLPVSWSCLSWNEISTWITYGFTKPMPHVDSGPLIITAKNVRDGVVEFDNVHRTTIEAFSSLRPKDKPTAGDILIVKDGATTGRASIAPATLEEYCISQSVAVVWLKYCPINRKFLLWNVQSQETQKKIKEVMAGMAMPHLSITDFGRMLVPIPPSDEIEEIVRRVEQLFAYADSIEQQVKAAKERVDNLTQAILAKAFRGELTADWRAANPELISGENSAAALLEKIKAERQAEKAKKKTAVRKKI
ncbi:restriction endonuclease subunit S [Aeromonas jandaei]|uniref:restriction endonuclease subunit S n=1 Tax=Aeromonas jandaei TaxID=650 RepID=UPI00191D6AB1|nr:restriction endonuclease subunit S [Aeromonas jandaei]MBL0625850.1 restriction endonuclease subunit S [Aeromonas jandaei]